MLAAIHLTGFLASIVYIVLYRLHNGVLMRPIIHFYTCLYLFLGATASINSQLLNGNIYAYLIILLGVAVIFPLRPKVLLLYFVIQHVYFLSGLFVLGVYHLQFKTNIINSTGAAVISYMIAYMLYSLRKRDFDNKGKLCRNADSFRRLFHMNPHPLVLINIKDGEILLINQQALDYYQLQGEAMERINGGFLFENVEEKEKVLKLLEEQRSIKNYEIAYELTPMKKFAMLSLELIEYLEQPCILVGVTDITSLKQKEEELLQHASFDPLTGVLNRRSGMSFLTEKMRAPFEQAFIVCYIDINGLKIVNDSYGHSAGDELIKACCKVFNCHIGTDDMLFRMGGDEFVIVFLEKGKIEVEKIWREIQEDFHRMNTASQKPYKLSASHGLAAYQPGMPTAVEELLEAADKAMYEEKMSTKKMRST